MYKNPLRLVLVALLCLAADRSKGQIAFKPYQAVTTGSSPLAVAIGDVNNDGRNDVVVTNNYAFGGAANYRMLVYIQNTNGTLASPVSYSYTPANNIGNRAMVIDDVNHDGRNDVIIGYTDSVSVCYQNASGNLDAPIRFYSGSGVDGIRTGDVNSDGKTDIVVSHLSAHIVRVFYQGTSGFSSTTFASPANANTHELEIADVNNDGKQDVILLTSIVSTMTVGAISIYTQTSAGSLNAYTSYYPPSPGSPFLMLYGLAVGDLNNDGRIDVAATCHANSPHARIAIWYQDTLTHLMRPADTISAYDLPQPLDIADLDCDGKSEIIAAHGGWYCLSVYGQNSAGAYGTYNKFFAPVSSNCSQYGMSVGDITGDGRKDVAIVDYNYGLLLLRNISAPPVITASSTTLVADTFYRDSTILQSVTLVANYTDTSGSYTRYHRDSLLITRWSYTDSVINDTTIIRSGIICSGAVTDTLVSSGLHVYYRITSDTFVLAAHVDSVKTSVHTPHAYSLNVYPVPTNRMVEITGIPVSTSGRDMNASLYTFTGRKMDLRLERRGTRLIADLINYPPGIFLIIVEAGGTRYFGRVIKE